MREYMAKYEKSTRSDTNRTIDSPMLIFLGLTLGDFITAVVAFLAVILSWDSGLAVPVAIFSSIAGAGLSKFYRNRFPRNFLQHWSWSLGIKKIPGEPVIFTNRRWVSFGP